jgi:nucleoside phosphorylase
MAIHTGPKVTVKLVTDCTDPDVLRALELYEKRVPENERFESPDIVRWLREDQERLAAGASVALDYFLVAKIRDEVCGFILVHFYPKVQLAFVAYLVVKRGISVGGERVSQRLLSHVLTIFKKHKHLKNCKGFVLEVDDPTQARTKKQRMERLARIRLFSIQAAASRLCLRALDFRYHQPPLSVPVAGKKHREEVPMILMYAARVPPKRSWMTKQEVSGLLKFIFVWLYPEGFSDVPEETEAYRKYLTGLYWLRISKLPQRIATLNFAVLRSRSSSIVEKTMKPPVDLVIITPLAEERDAVLSKLKGYRKLPPSKNNIRVYYAAELPVKYSDDTSATYKVIVVPLMQMGQQDAGNATGDAIRQWRPRFVLLVGIAGGLRKSGIKLGDVLIASQVANYEVQKLTEEGPEIRWQVHPTNNQLLLAVSNVLGEDWLNLIVVKRPGSGKPQVSTGVICTGNKVIADDSLAKQYHGVWRKLIGVEMEAGGVAAAAFSQIKPPGFFMVRGVSDFADTDKDRSRTVNWRKYACDVAASYAIFLLASGPFK